MTILDAVKAVMLANSTPMTAEEIYRAIRDQALYEFHSRDALGIVKRQIRRHCEGLDLTMAAPVKHFRMVSNGRYELLKS